MTDQSRLAAGEVHTTGGNDGGEYRFPLSYPQLRLWFLEQLAPGDPAYHMPIALRLTGRLDVTALDRAFQHIVDRHEVLRTAFAMDDGEPFQAVRMQLEFPLTVVDLTGVADPERSLTGVASTIIRRAFDLSRAPLLRAVLARLNSDEHVLIVAVHHIMCDGWSVAVLAAELSTSYSAFVGDREPELPELTVQYGDFAVWQHEFLAGEGLDAVLAHWTTALAGAPAALDLPTDHARLLVATSRGAHVRRTVPPDLAAAIGQLARVHGVSLFMAMLTAYAIVMSRMSGADDVVIGTPTAGRSRPEVAPLIGCFIDMLPMRVDLSGDPTAAQLLERSRAGCLLAFAHQEVPFERLVEHLRPERDLPRTPIFQVMMTLQDTPEAVLDMVGLTAEPVRLDQAAAKYELTLNIEHAGGDLLLDLEYNRDLFEVDAAERVLAEIETALSWLSGVEPTRLSQARLLPVAERARLSHLAGADQIELLDNASSPVPLGAIGEICAAGVRTGELGRWDRQGRLVRLGPPGDLVNVRGYRITPDDVRACLMRHPAIVDCVVVARAGALIGYVVAGRERQLPSGGVAEVLRAELPAYQLPTVIVELDRLPLDTDGNVDRTALPEPATGSTASAPVAYPLDDRDIAILECFRRVLRRPAFQMADDFFEHGGSSLKAVRLVAEIDREVGVQLLMRELFRAPTPLAVAASVRGSAAAVAGAALPEADARLASDIRPSAPHGRAWDPEHVLLTGATGFLGHALLEQLLRSPGTTVTCLVRAPDDQAAEVRLGRIMRRFGFDIIFDGRVRAIAGDVTAPRLGLSARRHDELAQDVAAIYHCAADVSFATPYAALRDVNVSGTAAVIRFAATGVGKALHYVSTLGQAAAVGQLLAERRYPPGAAASSGYVTSKRVAENLVAHAADRGLPTTILRPGLVTAHRVSGAMGEHDQLALGLRAVLHTGILPDLPELPIHIMPADQVAEAIVGIGRCPAAAGRVIHLYNPRPARLGDVAAILEQLGYPARLIPVAEWAEAIGGSALPASARLLVRMFAESPDRVAPSIETAAASAVLARPVEFSGLTAGYLQRAIAHLLTRTEAGERS